MIFDCLMLRNELDVLQMRLEELEHLVDMHVLVEARQDFHGQPKGLSYANGQGRFLPWRDKIRHVVVEELPEPGNETLNPWIREHAQRDAALGVLEQLAHPLDVVLICDADEIPSAKAIEHAMFTTTPFGLSMRTAHSAVDWLYPQEMPGSVIAHWRDIEGHKLSEIRDGRPNYPLFAHGGWHLSWLSDTGSQVEKFNVTCHLELPPDEVTALRTGSGYETGHHYDINMVPVDVDYTWPRFVYQRKCPPSWFRPRPVE